jgi:hypothetical protein
MVFVFSAILETGWAVVKSEMLSSKMHPDIFLMVEVWSKEER